MIKKSLFAEELANSMIRELQPLTKRAAMNDLTKAVDYLHSAMDIFEEAGMTAKANQVLSILNKIACNDEQHAHDHKPKSDTQGLTSEKMVNNLKHHGTVFNLADDGAADDLLNVEVEDKPLQVSEPNPEKTFEDEDAADVDLNKVVKEVSEKGGAFDMAFRTASKYGQQATVPTKLAPAKVPAPKVPVAPTAAPAPAAPAPTTVPAAPAPVVAPAAAEAAAAKAAALVAAKAAAKATATAARDAAQKLKELETTALLRTLMFKRSDNAAPSAHIRSWDPKEKGVKPSEKPSINHVEGNIGTDRKATDAEPGIGVDAPSHKATDASSGVGVDAPSHRATDVESGKGVDAPSRKATDSKSRDSSDARTAGGAKIDRPTKSPAAKAPTGGSGGNGPSDVRSPTSTEVRSPTSTEVRSPTSTEVRSPTSTSTEVRSPTSTSTEAYTADNFTATITGGAGAGANTTVNIYVQPPTTKKTNLNTPQSSKDKEAEATVNYLISKYG